MSLSLLMHPTHPLPYARDDSGLISVYVLIFRRFVFPNAASLTNAETMSTLWIDDVKDAHHNKDQGAQDDEG